MPNESGLSGPHISAAFLCQQILQEKDNVPSFIRVAERFNVAGPTPEMQPSLIQTTIVVSMKAGTIGAGKYKVSVRINKPDGGSLGENEIPIFFEGGQDHGVLIGMPIGLIVPEEGLYWIDVLFESALMTRIPFRVIYQRSLIMGHPGGGQ